MHIALAPFHLRDGVTEAALVAASDEFEQRFVREQDGIVRRILVKDAEGGYADIVFFEDAEAIERVVAAEQSSDACAAFFELMAADDRHGVYEVVKTYE